MEKGINFAWPVTTLCKFDYRSLKSCIDENKNIFEQKIIVIFGAGIRGTAFSILLKKFGFNRIVFTDNNEQKVGGFINEYPIIAYEEVVKRKEEEVVIISVENGFVLKNQLEKSGFVENVNYFYVENHLYDLYLNEFIDTRHVETLIMGDCGITDISKTDDDFTNLGELLKQKLGEDGTKVLAVHAMGMRAFYHILSAHLNYISVPERVVIMANFETFTGKQHLLPRSQHARLIQMISEAVGNRDEELVEYVKVTKERFENFKVDYFASSKDTLKKMSREKNDKIVIRMNYMYDLKEDNECIVYMKKIIELCRQRQIKLFFFIPPANYMYAQELYGDLFTKKYKANVSKLTKLVNSEAVDVLDLSYVLTKYQFADIHTIDETTNYEGRKIVSDKLAEKINSMRSPK
jgi:hypothetical protein